MRRQNRPKGAAPTTSTRLKLFRPVSWYDRTINSVSDYVEHLLTELGRLGLKVHDIEQHSRPPHTETVLSDVMDWLSQHPGKAYAKLVDWRTLDLHQLQVRTERNRFFKPRIEVSAHITKMNNFSVRWHPRGWRDAEFDWHRTDQNHFNLITHRKWTEPPDFHWFQGDEEPTFESRPSNELMYLRGVGNLRPEPCASYGPYATFNSDVVDSILICAVRAAYEGLITQLKHSFDVHVIDAFDFVLREEIDGQDEMSQQFPIRRVVAWSLEDAAELAARRARDASAEQERRDREELADLPGRYGFTVESFVSALVLASSKKPTGPAPTRQGIDRNAAKALRNTGSRVDAGDVRRVRQLVERYAPDALPPVLRSPESNPQTDSGVTHLPSDDE